MIIRDCEYTESLGMPGSSVRGPCFAHWPSPCGGKIQPISSSSCSCSSRRSSCRRVVVASSSSSDKTRWAQTRSRCADVPTAARRSLEVQKVSEKRLACPPHILPARQVSRRAPRRVLAHASLFLDFPTQPTEACTATAGGWKQRREGNKKGDEGTAAALLPPCSLEDAAPWATRSSKPALAVAGPQQPGA